MSFQFFLIIPCGFFFLSVIMRVYDKWVKNIHIVLCRKCVYFFRHPTYLKLTESGFKLLSSRSYNESEIKHSSVPKAPSRISNLSLRNINSPRVITDEHR